MNKAKIKAVAMTGASALVVLFVMASVAKRVPAVAKAQAVILGGV